eukprot:6362055-Prymnesium_polylepis.1
MRGTPECDLRSVTSDGDEHNEHPGQSCSRRHLIDVCFPVARLWLYTFAGCLRDDFQTRGGAAT